MRYHSVGVAMIVLGGLVGSSFGATLLEDDFSSGLGQWNIESFDSSYYVDTASADGQPPPSAIVDGLGTDWASIRSKTGFNYVGRNLTFSADMKLGEAVSAPVSTNMDIHMMDIWGTSLASLVIQDDPAGDFVYCSLNSGADGTTVAISDARGWHRGMIAFRSDGYVEYYLDEVKLWTSNVTVDPQYDGQADLSLLSWQSYYDNVLVTPEPAALALFALGGFAVTRRRRARA